MYEIVFDENVLAEWRGLDRSIRLQFQKGLTKMVDEPHWPANKLRGMPNCYKIKLRRWDFDWCIK
jgi:mRNA interferase RelE/StbE